MLHIGVKAIWVKGNSKKRLYCYNNSLNAFRTTWKHLFIRRRTLVVTSVVTAFARNVLKTLKLISPHRNFRISEVLGSDAVSVSQKKRLCSSFYLGKERVASILFIILL